MKYPKGTKTFPVSVRLSEEQVLSLKRMARNLAVKEDRDVAYQDLIREAVEKVYFSRKKNG